MSDLLTHLIAAEAVAVRDLSLDEAQSRFREFAGAPLSPTIIHPRRDEAIRAMADIALMAKRQQAGWGRLGLQAHRELGKFLIHNAARQGRPRKEKTSPADVLPTLADLGITDRHISADAKNVARVSQKNFDAYLATEDEPTLKGLLRFANAEHHPSAAAEAMNVDFRATSTEWYTPPNVFEAMATKFDLDVSSPGAEMVPWIPAKHHYTRKEDGLKQPWRGFCWMNGPYGLRNGMMDWIDKFIQHGDGVALVPDFTSTAWWQKLTAHSDCILQVCPKIQFLPKRDGLNTLGTTLVAIGKKGVRALDTAEKNGLGICFRRSIGPEDPEPLEKGLDDGYSKPHYWVTPADIMAGLVAEFGPLYDPCPHPRPDGFDGLSASWKTEGTAAAYCNPPFTTGFMGWVKKALGEREKGVTVLLAVPIYQNRIIAMLTEAGAEIRYLGVPNWLSLEDGTPNPAPMVSRQPCVLAVLRARPVPIPCDIEKLKASGARHWWWGVPWPGANMTVYPRVNDDIDITRFARQEARRVSGERLSVMRVLCCAGRDTVALESLLVAAKDLPTEDRSELLDVLKRLLAALREDAILGAEMAREAEAAD